jgi:hypothetical protein
MGDGMRRLHLELVCRADSAAKFAELAGSWLTDARAEFFPELSRRLPDAPALQRQQAEDPGALVGPPDSTWAQTVVYREATARRGTSDVVYTPHAWQQLLAGLASEYPFGVLFVMMPLDAEGRLAGRRLAASVGVRRDRSDPAWVRFQVDTAVELAWWPDPAEIAAKQAEWVDRLERWAIRLDACYGHLTDDASNTYGTALEMATQRPGIDPPTVPRCHEMLRGYSWVTICAAELAQRLGGAGALAAAGAFHEVRQLPGGQVLLQATPLLEQYEGTAVEQVFRLLAPVLLPGLVTTARMPRNARLLVGVDAADYR